jgi:hypothetical protein
MLTSVQVSRLNNMNVAAQRAQLGTRLANLDPYGTTRYVDGGVSASGVGTAWGSAFKTITEAEAAAAVGDTILIANTVEYDENVTITKAKLTLIGVGAQGSVRITGLADNGTGLTINGASDVALYNLNVSGRGTGAGLKLMGQIRRLRAEKCRFAGGADGVLVNANAGGQLADARFDDCRLEGTNGVHFTAGGGDPASQIYFKKCDFQYCAGRCLFTDGIHVTGLFVQKSNFLPEEDGSAPATKWITANAAGTTGSFDGNFIAHATNAANMIEIADGVMWVANMTEAGVSTARPA